MAVILFRLVNGIEKNSFNWRNCTMHVQDFESPAMNMTAEIPEKDAINFTEMCRLFASTTLHERIIDEYLLMVSKLRTAILNSSTLDINSRPI